MTNEQINGILICLIGFAFILLILAGFGMWYCTQRIKEDDSLAEIKRLNKQTARQKHQAEMAEKQVQQLIEKGYGL